MSIVEVRFENFTAFKKLKLSFTPGINVFLGTNGMGKTHVMKAVYAGCEATKRECSFLGKLIRVYGPWNGNLRRLTKRQRGSATASLRLMRKIGQKSFHLKASFSNHAKGADSGKTIGVNRWSQHSIKSTYIPVKEMLAHAPGFVSLYEEREISFEEVYVDIIRKASLPRLRGPLDKVRKNLLKIIQKSITGKVIAKEEGFFLRNKQGSLEFTLLAEGICNPDSKKKARIFLSTMLG